MNLIKYLAVQAASLLLLGVGVGAGLTTIMYDRFKEFANDSKGSFSS